MNRHTTFILFTLLLVLAGCAPQAMAPSVTPEPAASATPAPTINPQETQAPEATSSPPGPPQVIEYDLGEATLTQSMFAEDSRFRNMPVRLNGIIAAPTEGNGPFPVVLIMHGTHPGCPIPEGDEVDRWPCDPQLEQPNYRGFAYLVRELAENGYVALSININAENTFGFGEPVPGERLGQLIDMHLQAVAEANRGEPKSVWHRSPGSSRSQPSGVHRSFARWR